MNQKIKHLIIFFLSLTLLLATPFILRPAYDHDQMKNLRLGYPFAYITQDFSIVDQSISYFPNWKSLILFDKDFPIKEFSIVKFLASLIIIFASLEILILVLEEADFKIRRMLWKEEDKME